MPLTCLFVCLESQRDGSIFTLFLQSPLTAFCFCCDIAGLSVGDWDRAQAYVDRFMAEASRLISRGRTIGKAALKPSVFTSAT